MTFVKGKPRPASSGRKPGSINKTTASVKEALTDAFEQLGGVDALVKWGKDNPTLFYPLWVRIAPQQHDVTSNGQTIAAVIAQAFAAPIAGSIAARPDEAHEQPYASH